MNLLYGFDLILPKQVLRSGINVLARHAGYRGCTVVIPDERAIQAPFDGNGEDDPIDVFYVGKPEPFTWLNCSLWLPIDDCVSEYLRPRGLNPITWSI